MSAKHLFIKLLAFIADEKVGRLGDELNVHFEMNLGRSRRHLGRKER